MFLCFVFLRVWQKKKKKNIPRKMLRLSILLPLRPKSSSPERVKLRPRLGATVGEELFWERAARCHHMMPLVRYWKPS